MCSFVRHRIARCASLSLARFLVSWAGVRVATLLLPASVSDGVVAHVSGGHLPFRFVVLPGSDVADRRILVGVRLSLVVLGFEEAVRPIPSAGRIRFFYSARG